MLSVGRDECLRQVVEHLGGTSLGRELGLHRVGSLADLRALVPIRDADAHRAELGGRLGFAETTARDVDPVMLAAGHLEREHVAGVWLYYLGEKPPQRVALLRGDAFDRAVDEILLDDLRGLGGELLRIDDLTDPAARLRQLEALDPDLLVVPSTRTVGHLEAVDRAPIECRLPSLRAIFAEHDLKRPARTRVPVRSAGWIGEGGRLGLASVRPPRNAVTLALGSQIIELLPYSNLEEDARRVFAPRTILPEEAVVGQRYELVVTSPQGLLRQRPGEHVRVVGFDAPSRIAPFPRPRVVRLAAAPADVVLDGCTLSGAWVAAAIRQSLRPEDPALVQAVAHPDPGSVLPAGRRRRPSEQRFSEFFAETELAGLTKTGTHRLPKPKPRAVAVRIELQGLASASFHDVLAQRIDRDLCVRSPAYAHLRSRQELLPPRVVLVAAGTRQHEEAQRVQALAGRVWLPEVRVLER